MSHFEKVYFDDLMNDEALNLVSDSAWKLWVKMFLYMGTKSPQRGRLLLPGNRAATAPQLARILATEIRKLRRCMAELERHHVFSRDADGTIICRRQIRDAEESERMAKNGRRGRTLQLEAVVEVEPEDAVFDAPETQEPCPSKERAPPGIWHLASNQDLNSDQKEGVQREVTTLARFTLSDNIPNDATGLDEIRELWNAYCGHLPKCERLERSEQAAICSLLQSNVAHYRTRKWWIDLAMKASRAEFKRWGKSALTLGWIIAKDEHLAALMRGDYDFAAETTQRPTAADASIHRTLDELFPDVAQDAPRAPPGDDLDVVATGRRVLRSSDCEMRRGA